MPKYPIYRLILATFLVFSLLWIGTAAIYAAPPSLALSQKKAEKVQSLDAQIEELEDMKRGFEAKAVRHEDQADRLQFDDKTYLEMRRHNQLAAENRAKAAEVQKEIDRLQAEKAKILKN